MGKRSSRIDPKSSDAEHFNIESQNAPEMATLDPALDALFKSSLTDSTLNLKRQRSETRINAPDHAASETSSSGESSESGSEDANEDGNELSSDAEPVTPSRSRKRKREDEGIEARYLNRLAEEQHREASKQKSSFAGASSAHQDALSDTDEEIDAGVEVTLSDSECELPGVPQHEVLAADNKDAALDKAKRTVFLSNVSTSAISSKASRRTLLDHLVSFAPQLPEHSPPHKVESIRFRSTAYALVGIPKRAAYAKKELMEATTKSSNAYVVYSTDMAAREAVKRLNGSMVLNRHLRVDSVAHPAPIDHHRCVFVGNLGFVDDESQIKEAQEAEDGGRSKKSRPPGDVEEGLWRQFLKAGQVESVRVVRDSKTRVGKGFAYVQFTDGNAVERALTYHDKKFPPLLPRPLRVVRAKHPSKTASSSASKRPKVSETKAQGVYNPKLSAEAQSLAGRAHKLLGKGGAARLSQEGKTWKGTVPKGPESFVFEGHRARPGQGANVLKGAKKGKGKPNTRSSRRGAAYKAAGGKRKAAS